LDERKDKPKVPHINARAETVEKLPLFREAFAKRRCLIPATGFYEWQKREDGKQPYRFAEQRSRAVRVRRYLGLARIGGEEILSTAIIVGEANPLVGGVHDRGTCDGRWLRSGPRIKWVEDRTFIGE
jgi:putative SOS response-associated peptidase YedK